MDRRNFLKKSILGLGAFLVINGAAAISGFAASIVEASEGKLGYKLESRFPSKNCLNCKSYQQREKEEMGQCILTAMKKVMKAEVVLVEKAGHCNMWAKIV